MSDEVPDVGELVRTGLYDPAAAGAATRLALIRYVVTHGGSLQEVADARSLNELAVDVKLRPRTDLKLAEVVEGAGVRWDLAEPVLVAVGFPSSGNAMVTDAEAQSIRLLLAAGHELLGMEAAVQIARVTNNAMARVADTLVSAFRLGVELPRRDAGADEAEIVSQVTEVADVWLPPFVEVLDMMLRRHIVGISERMWSADAERSAVTVGRTVGFVDLVGYTEAAAGLSVRELATMLIDFDTRTSGAVARGSGQIIKTIGDEAMFVTLDPSAACAIAAELADGAGGTRPAVRVGLASGQMVSMFGDLYGPDVNLAARLVASALPGSIVVSESVQADAAGFDFEQLVPMTLKGFAAPVTAYRLLSP